MTREEYIKNLNENYLIVKKLSNHNENLSLQLRHRKLEKDIVVHSFQNEYSVYEFLCGITHENLPYIYDVISLSDGQIVLEEHIDGLTIAEVMESTNYHYKSAKKVLRALCSALYLLHQNGFIHRDIKPENVMVTKDGRVILIDYNASRVVKSTKRDTQVLGTVGYAAPEQMGLAQSDARTDIYALGVLLNVMLTGCHPSEKLANGKARKIIRKCTSANPDDRYKDTKKLYKAL